MFIERLVIFFQLSKYPVPVFFFFFFFFFLGGGGVRVASNMTQKAHIAIIFEGFIGFIVMCNNICYKYHYYISFQHSNVF